MPLLTLMRTAYNLAMKDGDIYAACELYNDACYSQICIHSGAEFSIMRANINIKQASRGFGTTGFHICLRRVPNSYACELLMNIFYPDGEL